MTPRLALVDALRNRRDVHAILQGDYELAEFDDGLEALEGMLIAPPDVLLLGLSLPTLPGSEVLRRLRAHPRLAPIPVVALAACGTTLDRGRCLAEGFDSFVATPIMDEWVLRRAIAEQLRVGPLAVAS